MLTSCSVPFESNDDIDLLPQACRHNILSLVTIVGRQHCVKLSAQQKVQKLNKTYPKVKTWISPWSPYTEGLHEIALHQREVSL